MEKKSLSLKPIQKCYFPKMLFCPRSVSNRFGATESRKVFFKGNVYDFLLDYNAINKSGILNIHSCLMVKSNIK